MHNYSLVHRLIKILILIFCFLKTINYTLAQAFYTTNKNYIKTVEFNKSSFKDYQAAYPDTSINNLNQQIPINYLGNLGLPNVNYIWGIKPQAIGFKVTESPYLNFTENDVKFYQTKGPYAQLTGIAGTKVYQYFDLLFTNTFKNKLNIALAFKRYTSTGFYRRQQSYTNNFYLSLNHETKNKRFGWMSYIIANTNNNQENGGIVNDTLKEKEIKLNKEVILVNLTSAKRKNNDVGFYFNPYLRLNSYDSLNSFNHFINLKSKLYNNVLKYTDDNLTNNNYYYITYFDTLKTKDSTNLMQLQNSISYDVKTENNYINIGYKNEYNRVYQYFDSIYLNHIIYSNWYFKKPIYSKDSLKTVKMLLNNHLKLSYDLQGYNKNDYQLLNELVFKINAKKFPQQVGLNLLIENRQPNLLQQTWYSNHFNWNNNFSAVKTSAAQLNYSLKQTIYSSVNYANISNLIYFDNIAIPRQILTPINVFSTKVEFKTVCFKHLGLSAHYTFQTTDGNNYLYLPNHYLRAKLFYEGFLAHKNLWMQIGAQVQTFSSFYSYDYMPVTQVFYLQDQKQTGQYWFTEFFLNARIRPVNFFIRVENALQGFLGKNYALVNGYYQPDRAFRFGVTWQFFD